MRKILLPHGKLTDLAKETGFSANVCSRYLRGLYDDSNESSAENARIVREKALSLGGGYEKAN